MISYSVMVNAWSLLYDEIYGDDEMSPCSPDHQIDDINIAVGSGNTAAADTYTYCVDTTNFADIKIDTSALDNEHLTISSDSLDSVVDYDLSGIDFTSGSADPITTELNLTGMDIPTPSIKDPSIRKYKEDESIKALQDYISTTYGGHYTSDNNNVQTLDLIESVGDAESFCRSNAIKYLSRYDKKGQAKRDILKALHYSLLLYHFSGQLNETTTRGYETF